MKLGAYREPALVRVDSPEEPPPFKVDKVLVLGAFYCAIMGLDAAHRGAIAYAAVAWSIVVVTVLVEVLRWREQNT